MYFDRTLEDWIGFKINNRTRLTLQLVRDWLFLAAQKSKPKKEDSNFHEKKFLQEIQEICVTQHLLYLQKCMNPKMYNNNKKQKGKAFPIH